MLPLDQIEVDAWVIVVELMLSGLRDRLPLASPPTTSTSQGGNYADTIVIAAPGATMYDAKTGHIRINTLVDCR